MTLRHDVSSNRPLQIDARVERWPIAGSFTISRGTKREAVVVVAEIGQGSRVGRGEAVPYARYGETPESVLAEIASVGVFSNRDQLQGLLGPGAARNALDCALIDYEAKSAGTSAATLLGLDAPGPVTTCYTLSLDTPEAMAAKAVAARNLPVLKLKLGGDGDAARIAAVRAVRPDARIVADANEAWTPDQLVELLAAAAAARLELIEQPLPVGADAMLAHIRRAVPVCADESAHTSADLARLTDRYDAVNIKLDKSGGLTEAIKMKQAARNLGLKTMIGCMVATSLAMAPALLLAGDADWVDLDGPLLLAGDRGGGLDIVDGIIQPCGRALWS